MVMESIGEPIGEPSAMTKSSLMMSLLPTFPRRMTGVETWNPWVACWSFSWIWVAFSPEGDAVSISRTQDLMDWISVFPNTRVMRMVRTGSTKAVKPARAVCPIIHDRVNPTNIPQLNRQLNFH